MSAKTGEAGRYQMLKRAYGINPLAKIGVFKDGGTVDVGSNILSGFSNPTPRIDLSGLEGRRQTADVIRQLTSAKQFMLKTRIALGLMKTSAIKI